MIEFRYKGTIKGGLNHLQIEDLTPLRVKYLGQLCLYMFMHIVGMCKGNPTSLVVSEPILKSERGKISAKRSLHTKEGHVHNLMDE